MPDRMEAVTMAALAVMRSSGEEKDSAARKRDMVKPMPASTPAPRKWAGSTFGHPGQSRADEERHHEADAEGLPEEEAADDAQPDGRGEMDEAVRRERDARIGEGKDRHDEEGVPRRERVLPPGEGRLMLGLLRAGRGKESHEHARHGGMDACMMEGEPQGDAAGEVDEGRMDAFPGGQVERRRDDSRRAESGEGRGVAVEERQHHDAAQIIHDGQRRQEDRHAFRYALGGEGEHAQRKAMSVDMGMAQPESVGSPALKAK